MDPANCVPGPDGNQSEGRSATPPRKRVARAVTAPESIRGGVTKRKQAICRRPGTSSRFRGVTHHCRTGRWEAHIWEEGKQVYLGGFDNEEQAALAYDIAAIKFRAHDATTNYSIENYEQELLHFEEVSKEEVVQSLRRQSRGAQKTSSQYRGVTKHMKGKWEARIGQMVGRKYKYLGLYKEEVDAAIAYDKEAVRRRGIHAITNFDLSEYIDLLDASSIAEAEQRHLFKPKPQAVNAVTTQTTNGLFYTQATQSMEALQQGSQAFAEVQLLQADLQQSHERHAFNGSYTVVNQPMSNAEIPAPLDTYLNADEARMTAMQPDSEQNTSDDHGGTVKWCDNFEQADQHTALHSHAASHAVQMSMPVWDAQQALQAQYSAVAKKGAPADVSRHDTPTSVFDIFNSLSIMPVSPQQQHHGHITASSGMVLGQDPALTELPHMNMNPHGYQAMITDDDDWLQDFASAQLQVHDHDSPSSVHNEPEAEQARQHAVPDNNIDATTRKQAAEEKIEV